MGQNKTGYQHKFLEMERTKSSSGRGGKSKTPQFPADLYALGSKSTTDSKQRSGTLPPNKVVPGPGAGNIFVNFILFFSW